MQIQGVERVNEYTDPELIKDSELTVLTNMTVVGNKAKKRGAIKSYNLTNAGGSIVDLIELNDSLLGLIDTGSARTLKISSGGAWTSLQSSMADTSIKGLQYRNKAYLTNGVAAPLVTDGSTVWDLALPTPDLTNTTTNTVAAGSLDADAVYRYAICYLTDKGEVGNYSIIGHRISGSVYSTSSTYKLIQFSSLPVSTRADITGRRIYRTEGNGDVFYWLKDIDNVVTTLSDGAGDSLLDTSESLIFTDMPSIVGDILIHKDRLILSNTTMNPYNSVSKPPKVDLGLSSSTGSTGDNFRYYAITYEDSQGNESSLSDATRCSTIGSTWTVTISYIPMPLNGAGSFDNSISKINLYRKTDSGSFYKIKSINLNTISSDKYITSSDAHLVNGNVYTAPTAVNYNSRLYYSEIDKFAEIGALNYVDVFPQDNEAIVKTVDQPDGILVFKEKSVCMVYTNGSPYNWRVVKLIENIGCSNAKSVQRAKNAVYFQYNQDFYRYPDMQLVSQSFQNTLDFITVTNTTYVSKYNWYVLVASNHVYVYDERTDGWYDFTATDASFSSAIETIDKNFYIGLTTGETLKYDVDSDLDYNHGSDLDEDTINCTLKSKHFLASSPLQLLRLRKLFINLIKGQDTLNVALINPQTSVTKTVGITGTGAIDYRGITDSFTGNLRETTKVRFELSGDITEFNSMRLEGTLKNRNRIWS